MHLGCQGKQISQKLLQIDEINASSGNIFLVCGSSGTGKSVLLEALAGLKSETLKIDITLNNQFTSSFLSAIQSEEALIDYFSKNMEFKILYGYFPL